MALSPGALLDGKYRIVRTLGEGGMGVVYVAEHTLLRKQVAVKLLRAELAQHDDVAARFEQEARTTCELEHPNIVRVTDLGCSQRGELYIVMELLFGRSLAEEMADHPKLPVERALWIARQVLAGLEAAHAHGVIHRDLKPENVFLTQRPDGTEVAKLVDFGIAKLKREASVKLTTTGMVLGTPQYMSPEQARGQSDLDARADLHSVGVMLYEMLCGRPPYEGDNYNQVLFAILSGPPAPLSQRAPELDPALEQVVMKALAPAREARYQTATALREALEDYQFAPAQEDPEGPFALPDQTPRASAAPVEPEVPARVRAPAPLPVEPSQPTRAQGPPATRATDPFAPPDEAEEAPLEIATSPRPARRPTPPGTEAALQTSALVELNAQRQAHRAKHALGRRLLYCTAALIVATLGVVWWNRPAPVATEMVRPARAILTLEGAPENAVVLVDGVRSFLNPIELPIDGAGHELRIECEGYRTRTVPFSALGSQVIDAHLERLPPRRRR
jgi:serine/threonine-protein kinase